MQPVQFTEADPSLPPKQFTSVEPVMFNTGAVDGATVVLEEKVQPFESVTVTV